MVNHYYVIHTKHIMSTCWEVCDMAMSKDVAAVATSSKMVSYSRGELPVTALPIAFVDVALLGAGQGSQG